eukprot:TRINITY_DN14208_c0_g3_i1.p1 TRINITY_DN14208_c0_g3~~TRINITY_DN14208_c0_g3_i1.p1  ORF type:complete len:105 (+),score=20.55 TRINITY_DN14208_c0_g3_i1:372-686(+)
MLAKAVLGEALMEQRGSDLDKIVLAVLIRGSTLQLQGLSPRFSHLMENFDFKQVSISFLEKFVEQFMLQQLRPFFLLQSLSIRFCGMLCSESITAASRCCQPLT